MNLWYLEFCSKQTTTIPIISYALVLLDSTKYNKINVVIVSHVLNTPRNNAFGILSFIIANKKWCTINNSYNCHDITNISSSEATEIIILINTLNYHWYMQAAFESQRVSYSKSNMYKWVKWKYSVWSVNIIAVAIIRQPRLVQKKRPWGPFLEMVLKNTSSKPQYRPSFSYFQSSCLLYVSVSLFSLCAWIWFNWLNVNINKTFIRK